MASRAGILAVFLAALSVACGAPDDRSAGTDAISVEPGTDGPLGKADSAGGEVELKVTLRPDQIGLAKHRFGLRDSLAAERDVWFYDTAELDHYQQGVILRGRNKHGEADDSTVKLRPMAREDVAPEWFGLAGFKCEEDRTPDKSISSCSLTVVQAEDELEEIADGKRDVEKAFSSQQEELLATYAETVVDWDSLLPLGPVQAQVWTVKPKTFAQKLTMELWELPDASQLLEVSLRATPALADERLAALVSYLASRGFDTSQQGETKTRAAMELFADTAQP